MITDLELFEKLKLFDWLNSKVHSLPKKGKPKLQRAHGIGRVLSVLAVENDLSTRELANRVGIRISSLNEILAKLAEDDVIERLPLKEDRRIKINHLTPKGFELARSISDHPLFECLSATEKEELGRILDKLNDRVETFLIKNGGDELRESCCKRREALERFLKSDHV